MGLLTFDDRPSAPGIAFRVGVTGHRPNRLGRADLPQLEARVAEVLGIVRAAVEEHAAVDRVGHDPAAPPALRLISPLADGADRMAARQALACGYRLSCPLPFSRAEYEKDFSPASVDEFRQLLGASSGGEPVTVLELDGQRLPEGAAYARCSQVVLAQSDLLLAIWDGGGSRGVGGTYHALEQSLVHHVPVVWIDARTPHAWCLCSEEELRHALSTGEGLPASALRPPPDALRAWVRASLQPPADQLHKLEDHFAVRLPKVRFWIFWRIVRDLLACKGFAELRAPAVRVRRSTAPAGVHPAFVPALQWADDVSAAYADAYRSAFTVCYLLGAFAVFLAVWPMAFGWEGGPHHHAERILTMLEAATVVSVIAIFAIGKRRRWHERWMESRVVTELLRQTGMLHWIGGGVPFPQVSAHDSSHGDPSASWMYWHVRSTVRAIGMIGGRLTEASVREIETRFAALLDEQIAYHRTAAERMHRSEHRLHALGIGLFAVTALGAMVHLFVPEAYLPHLALSGIELGAACLPALGAAMASIANHGEFGRLARRSKAMAEALSQIRQHVRSAGNLAPGAIVAMSSDRLGWHIVRASQLMIDEFLDWQVMFKDRPLAPPG
jgi:hypothetical protein